MTNTVTLIGNLVEDPELRFTQSGIAMAKIRVAVNRRWRDQQNEWQEETSYFGGTLWREAAEHASESLTKGTRIIVTGSLEQRSWETPEGDKRSVVELRIDEIGPSLRWASAKIDKNERTDGGGGGGSDRKATQPVANEAPQGYSGGSDEEPF